MPTTTFKILECDWGSKSEIFRIDFCFLTTTSNWVSENKNIRFSFRMVIGETEQNYQELAKKSIFERQKNIFHKS